MGSSWHAIGEIQRTSASCPVRAAGYAEKSSGPSGARTERFDLLALVGSSHATTLPPILVKTAPTTLMSGHTVPPYNPMRHHRSQGTLASCCLSQTAEEEVDDLTRLNGENAGYKDIGQTAQSEGVYMMSPIEVVLNGLSLPSSQ
jgi:hypothetical protein